MGLQMSYNLEVAEREKGEQIKCSPYNNMIC
jgi:hypothetical protein